MKLMIVNMVENFNREELQIKTIRRQVRTYETEGILKKNNGKNVSDFKKGIKSKK